MNNGETDDLRRHGTHYDLAELYASQVTQLNGL